ncbi:hypothetical protein HMPREF0043_00192 [Actinobaculum sp. oral taxon 183 str. F0552]|nr:hypothetical protein HMPREF0043_00192 [Actinobaculum sp. oral taxon 183 str. F0552]
MHLPTRAPGIIPAYAGSTCVGPEGAGAPGDHPRIRGEHVQFYGTQKGDVRIIPAYAGSTSLARGGFGRPADHPRIRGEHDRYGVTCPLALGSSPHTRGALRDRAIRRHSSRIIPAYAGSTNAPSRTLGSSSDHPRIRGEHVLTHLDAREVQGSSPHTRGARILILDRRHPNRIIPAYAGSTEWRRLVAERCADHPRIRGEHRSAGVSGALDCGSSPHTRGARYREIGFETIDRIIPAYAGSTRWAATCCRAWPDHPRIRGEHAATKDPGARMAGSSPHTRGARRRHPPPPDAGWIIPAYAGSTSLGCSGSGLRPDHPRIRGEHVSPSSRMATARGSSPHTRGAPATATSTIVRSRIIPAYAGSTDSKECPSAPIRDHPRIRGEHRMLWAVTR